MRKTLLYAAALMFCGLPLAGVPTHAVAQTGDQSQTTKPDGSSGGHDCERKKEQATS